MIPPRQTTLSLRQGDIRCTFSLGKAPRNLLLSSCRHANGSPNFGEVFTPLSKRRKARPHSKCHHSPLDNLRPRRVERKNVRTSVTAWKVTFKSTGIFFFQLLTWSFLFGAKLLETSPVLCTMWCTPKSSVIWVVKIE